MNIWLSHHGRALVHSIGELWRSPGVSLLSVLVVAVSLALPLGLSVVVRNMQALVTTNDQGRQLSVMLDPAVDESEALDLLAKLEKREEIRRLELVSPDAAASELGDLLGVTDIMEGLGENPIPVTLIVVPEAAFGDVDTLATLANSLRQMPEVSDVIVDVQWLKRLRALTRFVRVAATVLGCVLALAVLLVVGNTVRLMVQSRLGEISVMNRVGATNAFIRRPFLYTGALHGFVGAVLAIILVIIAGRLMAGSLRALLESYGGSFAALGVAPFSFLLTLLAGVVIGWLASFWALTVALRRLRPD